MGLVGRRNWDTKRKRKVHKRCQKIGVRGSPDEGGQEEGGEVTSTQYDLIMQQLMGDFNYPTVSLQSLNVDFF